MKLKPVFILLLFVSSVAAQMATPVPSAVGLSTLTSGKYVATLSPAPDQGTANGIMSALQTVPGIESTSATGGSSTLQLTVRSNAQVDVGTLKQAITSVNPGLLVGTPQLAPPPAQNPALGPVH